MKAGATTSRQPKVLPLAWGKPLRPCQPQTPPPASLLAKYGLPPRPCQPKTRPPTRLLAAYGFPQLIRVGRHMDRPLNARPKLHRQFQGPPQPWHTGAANRRRAHVDKAARQVIPSWMKEFHYDAKWGLPLSTRFPNTGCMARRKHNSQLDKAQDSPWAPRAPPRSFQNHYFLSFGGGGGCLAIWPSHLKIDVRDV